MKRPSRIAAVAGFLGLLAPAVFVASEVRDSLAASHRRLQRFSRRGTDLYGRALARHRGAEYVARLQGITRVLAPQEPYLILESTPDDFDSYFVRFDWAPRPAVWLGRVGESPEDLLGRLASLEPGIHWVIVASLRPPGPELLSREQAAEDLRSTR